MQHEIITATAAAAAATAATAVYRCLQEEPRQRSFTYDILRLNKM